MSIDKARAYLAQWGMDGRVIEFETSSATVELAAQAAGTEPARIAKTLSFMIDGVPSLVVCAGDTRIDNRRFKDTFHTKPRMIARDQVEKLVGHGVGGVCPFGVNEGVRVYLDESLRRFETVFPAAGSSNSAIELTCDELDRVARPAAWVDICKDWER
ncbi:MAG: YbaK/EbsC family protein [Atopobiaceae bacterium]|nr:YbaK/EbsC family protein [Atopobiaceae bacterium]